MNERKQTRQHGEKSGGKKKRRKERIEKGGFKKKMKEEKPGREERKGK